MFDRSNKIFEKKKQLFEGLDLKIVSPSQWLADLVKQSFLKDYPVHVINNGIDLGVFKPYDSDFRKRHNLQNKKIVLGVASVWDARKGLKDFLALSELLDDRYKIVLIGLSKEQIDALPEEILGLPRTNSMQELAESYSAADVYVNPSTEETFGMTAMEARCCGTEAVVYENTACEEIVNQFGGIAVPRGAEHLLAAIQRLTEEETV